VGIKIRWDKGGSKRHRLCIIQWNNAGEYQSGTGFVIEKGIINSWRRRPFSCIYSDSTSHSDIISNSL
jgi:hypothetical protein